MNKACRIIPVIFLSLLLIFSLTGCSPGGKTANTSPQGNQAVDDGVKGKVLTGQYPAEITKYLEVNKMKETQRAFTINNRTVLVLTMGQQPAAGYQIALKNLVLKDGILKVSVKYEKPLKNDIVAAVITYPSLVIETDDIYEGHYEIKYDIER
ncbi:MAG: hypothetical protein AWM53_00004 [Candidatus Dichloromethanomonas elyunquensis]|nr:MAG: hypothetical protein AWM53_00004 [Candidatus Dichloromethanomonas elyunquensis]